MNKRETWVAILALPGMVTIVIPLLILALTNSLVFNEVFQNRDFLWLSLSFLLLIIGISLLVVTIKQFSKLGNGTLAPWDPPKTLIIEGLYSHVRNPMISGVIMIVLGEALILRSSGLWIYWLAVLILNLVYIPLVEEKRLEKKYGEAYITYKNNVPRWIPRLTAWDGP